MDLLCYVLSKLSYHFLHKGTKCQSQKPRNHSPINVSRLFKKITLVATIAHSMYQLIDLSEPKYVKGLLE